MSAWAQHELGRGFCALMCGAETIALVARHGGWIDCQIEPPHLSDKTTAIVAAQLAGYVAERVCAGEDPARLYREGGLEGLATDHGTAALDTLRLVVASMEPEQIEAALAVAIDAGEQVRDAIRPDQLEALHRQFEQAEPDEVVLWLRRTPAH